MVFHGAELFNDFWTRLYLSGITQVDGFAATRSTSASTLKSGSCSVITASSHDLILLGILQEERHGVEKLD